MAELNFGLLTPPGSQSIGNAFVQGMDQAAAARAQENQNALAQYTLSKARREDELTNKMLAGMQSATTLEQQAAVLRSVGRYKDASDLMNSDLERRYKLGQIAAQPGARAKTDAETTTAKLAEQKSAQDFRNQGLRDMANNSSDANIIAHHEDAVSRGMMTQTESDAQTKKLLAIPFDQRRAIFAQAGAPARAPEATPPDILAMQQLGYPPTQAGYAAFRAAQRQAQLLTPDEEAQKVRIAVASRPPPAPRAEAAPRTQQVTMRDGTVGIMNMDTGAVTSATLNGAPVKGKLSAFAEKTVEQQKQLGKNLAFGITQLIDITKDGGLIDQSTGSGAGRLVDLAAGFVGEAMPGAIAAGKIAPIADLALKLIPRFEGPQSNADTKSYKEAAGQLADSSLPREIRKEAGKVVLRIMQARKNQFVTSDMATEGAPGGVVDYGSLK